MITITDNAPAFVRAVEASGNPTAIPPSRASCSGRIGSGSRSPTLETFLTLLKQAVQNPQERPARQAHSKRRNARATP
ncbi:MAG: hypothetical protein HQM00_08050 [Magnetococcales bacterium]|nr:hypothetical protein [Magnetococcales bacterium]